MKCHLLRQFSFEAKCRINRGIPALSQHFPGDWGKPWKLQSGKLASRKRFKAGIAHMWRKCANHLITTFSEAELCTEIEVFINLTAGNWKWYLECVFGIYLGSAIQLHICGWYTRVQQRAHTWINTPLMEVTEGNIHIIYTAWSKKINNAGSQTGSIFLCKYSGVWTEWWRVAPRLRFENV
jgi:hypothetical protein